MVKQSRVWQSQSCSRAPTRAVPAGRLPGQAALVLGRAGGSGQVVTLELVSGNGCNLSIMVLPPPLAG